MGLSHDHLVYGQPSWTLDIGWCCCGAELNLSTGKWREPKTYEGKRRRLTWVEEEVGE